MSFLDLQTLYKAFLTQSLHVLSNVQILQKHSKGSEIDGSSNLKKESELSVKLVKL